MYRNSFTKARLEYLYVKKKKSVRVIARQFACSQQKIDYWLAKYDIPKRSISEAIYVHRNPNGDPFSFKPPRNFSEAQLFGLGIGLYWGEGTKKNMGSVRLGNTDAWLVKRFVEFLKRFYSIPEKKFRFGLQIFSDMDSEEALQFWLRTLKVSRNQFMKVIVTPARSVGNYREKTQHGVLTVYVSNRKLRNLLVSEIEKLSEIRYPAGVLYKPK